MYVRLRSEVSKLKPYCNDGVNQISSANHINNRWIFSCCTFVNYTNVEHSSKWLLMNLIKYLMTRKTRSQSMQNEVFAPLCIIFSASFWSDIWEGCKNLMHASRTLSPRYCVNAYGQNCNNCIISVALLAVSIYCFSKIAADLKLIFTEIMKPSTSSIHTHSHIHSLTKHWKNTI